MKSNNEVAGGDGSWLVENERMKLISETLRKISMAYVPVPMFSSKVFAALAGPNTGRKRLQDIVVGKLVKVKERIEQRTIL
jgi:hypothetical protein